MVFRILNFYMVIGNFAAGIITKVFIMKYILSVCSLLLAASLSTPCVESRTAPPAGGSHPLAGARWVGAPADSLPLYAPNLSVSRIDCDFRVAAGKDISLYYGIDDPRLMDSNLNIYGLSNQAGESWVKIAVGADGKVAVYRSGYHPEDNGLKPIATFDADLRPDLNSMTIESNYGLTNIAVNGKNIGILSLNPLVKPYTSGADYLTFPVIADMGIEVPDGCEVESLAVRNLREPFAVLHSFHGPYRASASLKLPVRSMPQLKSSVHIDPGKTVRNATLTASARGIYDVSVNDSLITAGQYFLPGSTQYNRTHLYHTFDITDALRPGENPILVQLAEGWWSGPSTFKGENWNFFGDRQSFIAAVDIEYSDGTTARIVTAPDAWSASTDGPVVVGSFFQGQIQDAGERRRTWQPAVEVPLGPTVAADAGEWNDIDFRPAFGDRVLPFDTLTAVSMTEPRPGVYIYDMGQNMAAIPLINFRNLNPGTDVTVRHAEVLYPALPEYAGKEGTLMTENLRAAMCRDIYRAAGTELEQFSPRYTLHGFRYLELSGLESPLPLADVRAVPLSSIHRFTADYECSDSLVNRLWNNIRWSSLSNFVSIPTDCPQRNERLGWMGDISVFAPTATLIADVDTILRQFLQSVRDCQSPDGRFPDVAPTGCGFGGLLWGSAGITVPWAHYSRYADPEVLRVHYPAMQRYITYILENTIDPSTDVIVQTRGWGDLGDWLSPEYERTDKSLIWECYFIHDLGIMADVARVLGLEADATAYDKLRRERIRHFSDTYIDPDTYRTRFSSFDPDRQGTIVDTQASYALPIAMGIVEDPRFNENFLAAVERSSQADDGKECPPYSLMTGFIGTAWISEALSRIGCPDVAYRLLTNTSYPSWLYPVTQGATTIWERLNSYTHTDGFGGNNSMNSFNHYSFGSVGRWLIERSLGLSVGVDGAITISPEPDTTGAITYASGWLDTPAGRVRCSWTLEPDAVLYTLDVPATATFQTPTLTRNLAPGKHRISVPR